MSTPTSMIDAAGTRIRVRVSGPDHAPPALLVHGIGRSLEDWSEQHDRLSGRHRLISLDLPGFGLSEPLRQQASLAGFADAAAAVLDVLEVSGPVDLVGNSLGGAVALHVLARHPHRVRTLALLDSAGFGREVIFAMRLLAVPGFGRRYLSRPTPASVRRAERSLYVDRAIATQARLDHALRVGANPGRVETYLAIAQELGTFRGVSPQWRREVLDEIAAHPRPTLLVWGKKDRILPVRHLQAAQLEFPHAQAHVLPGTGHLPQVERPDAVAALLTRFWATARRSSPGSPSRS